MTLMLQLEIQITLFIQAMGEWLAPFMNAITMLGNEEFYMLVMPILYWCIDPGVGFRTGALLILSGSINSYFKLLFHSPRPYWVDTRVKAFSAESSFGLPSGHSMNAAAIWGWLGMQMKRRWAVIFSVAVIFLIGFSRLYLGVHFTRDVLSGWLLGALLLFAFARLEKAISPRLASWSLGMQWLAIFVSSLVMIGLTFLSRWAVSGWQIPPEWVSNAVAASGVAPNPISVGGIFTLGGTWLGLAGGYAWMLKRGGFSAGGQDWKRILRYVVGVFGVLILYVGFKLIFPADPDWVGWIFRYIRYFIVSLWISALAPMLFIQLRLAEPAQKESTTQPKIAYLR